MDDLRRLREEWQAESERHWRESEARPGRVRGQEEIVPGSLLERMFLDYREQCEHRLRALEAEVRDLRQRLRELESR